MQKSLNSLRSVSLSLQQRYSELEARLDIDGFYKYVFVRLRAFNLLGHYDPHEVINECLIRLDQAEKMGKPIPNLAAWMRLTALNVVREFNRDTKKSDSYDPLVLGELASVSSEEPNNENREQYRIVRQALSTLSEDKRELLELRFSLGLSWEEIAVHYATLGKSVKVVALRKRGQRALEELREAFLLLQ
jgi:RNA polymerase sigma factor (sigma-70 family)